MIKEALQYLISLGSVDIKDVNGQSYSTKPIYLLEQSRVSALTVNSLSGFVDYLKSTFDTTSPLLIQVVSPTKVIAYSGLNKDSERDAYIQAEALLPSFRFGSWLNAEEFNIALQSVFVTNDDRAKILQVVGNIKDENVASFGDDGVSQSVKTKAGVATVADVVVPNPVTLKPYRTFVELPQPDSLFVFRMRSGPSCALFEADGGAWKIEAMDRVSAYLEEKLSEQIAAGTIVLIA